MQKEISDRVFLGQTASHYENAGQSSAIDRTSSNYNVVKEKIKIMSKFISTGKYDKDMHHMTSKIHPWSFRPKVSFQGMLEDIDTREKAAHSSYTDMEELDFQNMLTDNYYMNPSSIHICFPMKIKKKNLTKHTTLTMT